VKLNWEVKLITVTNEGLLKFDQGAIVHHQFSLLVSMRVTGKDVTNDGLASYFLNFVAYFQNYIWAINR
jgi:hypothetical protein